MKTVIIGIIALVIVVGGGILLFKGNGPSKSATNTNTYSTSTNTTTNSGSKNTSNTSSNQSTASSGGTESMTVTANDDSASPETINTKKGDMVKLTFVVSSQGTYHGGLDFKSTDPAIDSGSIAEGNSKTISFTATKSFKFTPYWYESNIQKDYFVTVNVQ